MCNRGATLAKSGLLSHTFFFFNACDVGQAKQTGNFVEGSGPAALSEGASGYIGALWPVNDQVAAKFSVRFYQLLQEQMQHGPADEVKRSGAPARKFTMARILRHWPMCSTAIRT